MHFYIIRIVIVIIVLISCFGLIRKIIKGGRASSFPNSFVKRKPSGVGRIGLSHSLGLRLVKPMPLLSPEGENFLNTELSEAKHQYLLETVILNFKAEDIVLDPLNYIAEKMDDAGSRSGAFLDISTELSTELGEFQESFDFERVVDNLAIGVKTKGRIRYLYNQLIELLMGDINVDFAEFVGQLTRNITLDECGSQTSSSLSLPSNLSNQGSLSVGISRTESLGSQSNIITDQKGARERRDKKHAPKKVPESDSKVKWGKAASKKVPESGSKVSWGKAASKKVPESGSKGSREKEGSEPKEDAGRGRKKRGSSPALKKGGGVGRKDVMQIEGGGNEEEEEIEKSEFDRIKALIADCVDGGRKIGNITLRSIEKQVIRDSRTSPFVKYSYASVGDSRNRETVISPNYNFMRTDTDEFTKIAYVPIKSKIRGWYTRNSQFLSAFCGYASYGDAIQYDNEEEDKNAQYVFGDSNRVKAFEFADIYPAQKASMMVLYLYLYFGATDPIPNLDELIAVFVLYVHKFNQFCSVLMERNWNGIILNEFVYVKNNNVQLKEMINVKNDKGGTDVRESSTNCTRELKGSLSVEFDNENYKINFFSMELKSFSDEKKERFINKIKSVLEELQDRNEKISLLKFNKGRISEEYNVNFEFEETVEIGKIIKIIGKKITEINEGEEHLLKQMPPEVAVSRIASDALETLDKIYDERQGIESEEGEDLGGISPRNYEEFLGLEDEFTPYYNALYELYNKASESGPEIAEKRNDIKVKKAKLLDELDAVATQMYCNVFYEYGYTHAFQRGIVFPPLFPAGLKDACKAGCEDSGKNTETGDDDDRIFSLLGPRYSVQDFIKVDPEDITIKEDVPLGENYSIKRVECRSFGREYIIFPIHNIKDSKSVEKIVCFATELSNINSQYICSYKSICSNGFYSLELINIIVFRHQTLQDVINTEFNGWSPNDRLNCIFSIVCGLKYLNDNHLSHRNLCPSNILVDDCKQCYLYNPSVYHQLVQIKNDIPFERTVYMAPEITDINSYIESDGNKNDIYSLGVLMYEILKLDTTSEDQPLTELIYDFKKNGGDDVISTIIKKCLINKVYIRDVYEQIRWAEVSYEGTGEKPIKELFAEFLKVNRLEVLAKNGNRDALNRLVLTEHEQSKRGEYFRVFGPVDNSLYKVLYCANEMFVNPGNHEQCQAILGPLSASRNVAAMFYYGVLLIKHGDDGGKGKGFDLIKSAAVKRFLPALRYYAYECTKEWKKEWKKKGKKEEVIGKRIIGEYETEIIATSCDLFVTIQYMFCVGHFDFFVDEKLVERMGLDKYSQIAQRCFIDLLEDDEYLGKARVIDCGVDE